MRVLTVTCNAAIDTTYRLPRLTPGGINRVEEVLPVPGGKGNNVARALAALGCGVIATGFAGGHAGRFIAEGLRAAGVEPAFVEVAGESRRCLTVVEAGGRTTELREPGEPVTPVDQDRLIERAGALAARVDAAVISGSLPPGADGRLYARLVALLRAAGVFVALDAGDDALRTGAAAGPDLIKPNREELAELLGPGPGDPLARAQRELCGPLLPPGSRALVSLGAEGAALVTADAIWRATPPPVAVVNAVGAGDTLLAGYLHARLGGAAEPEALAWAVAAGTAAVRGAAVGTVARADIERVRPLVRVAGPRGWERSTAA